jgi:NAD(P)H-dependent FMN reductase
MDKFFIPILLGSAREGRYSEHAAKFVLEEAKNFGQFETELLDVRDFVTYPRTGTAMTEEKAGEWSAKMSRADGLIIVSPEYNHGYPGELKLMLDQLYREYNRKPVGICGVSAGGLGGARMVEVLRIALIEFQMVPIRTAVYFSNAHALFDGEGKITDPAYKDKVTGLFNEVLWYAKALKSAREEASR